MRGENRMNRQRGCVREETAWELLRQWSCGRTDSKEKSMQTKKAWRCRANRNKDVRKMNGPGPRRRSERK